MQDERKTKAELIKELNQLRLQNNQLQKSNQPVTNKNKAAENGEKYFESLFENAPLGYQSLDEKGNFLDVNEAWCKTLGYEKNEVIGKNFGDFIHPDFREHFKKNFPKFKKFGQILGVEFEMIRKDGSEIIVSFNGKIGYHPDQTFKQTHCILHDITERKGIEESLRESEEFNRTIIDKSPLGISVRNAEGKLLLANNSWKKIWGISEETFKEYLSSESNELTFGEKDSYLGEWLPKVEKIYKKGGTLNIPELFLSKHRSEKPRWVSQTFYAIMNFEKKVDRVVILTEDITERKQAEKEVRIFKTISDRANYGTAIADLEGNIIYINKCFASMHGLTIEETIGKHLSIFHAKEQMPDVKQILKGIIKNGSSPAIEVWHKRKDGTVFPTMMNASVITDESDKPLHISASAIDITERKRAEETLKKSESLLKESQKVARLGSYFLDVKSGNWTCSDVLNEIFGLNEEFDKTTENWIQIVHPDDQEMIGQYFTDHVVKGKNPFDKEYRIVRHNDHQERWVHGLGQLEFDGDGQPIKMIGTIQDITERKQIEEAMRESQEHYKNFFDNALVGFFRTKISDGTFTEINSRAAEQLGLPIDEIIGKMHSTDLYRDADRRKELLTILKRDGVVHDFETELTLHDGRNVIFSISVKAYPDKDYLEGVVIDITKRKQAEEEIRKLAEVVKYSNELINMYDLDGNMIFLNEAGGEMLGIDPDDAHKVNIIEVIPEHLRELLQNELLPALLSGGHWKGDLQYRNLKTGKLTDVHATTFTVNNPKTGEPQFLANVSLDITETKRLREQESRAMRLESAGRVAGQIAHDFNNLLAPLVAYPDFIKEALPKNHPSLKYVNDMEKSANQIAEINQQLLTLSRRGHYNQEILNLNEVIQFAMGEMRILPQTLIIETDFAQNLMNVKGGAAQIHRILSNLINNARDAMQDVGNIIIKTENYYADNLTINYGHIPKGEYVKLTISDIGCGISEEIRLSIFDPFFTTKPSDKRRGSGLGLSVVDAVMKDHNGFIDLKSTVGEGTSFYLYFPITRESVDTTSEDKIIGGTESILVVDDDHSQCDVALKLLEKLGYAATAVHSGEEAVEYLKNNKRDLMLIDMIMPEGIDGTETFRQVLEICPDQQAIIISGFAESSRVEEARQLGIDIYIRKPLTLKIVASCIRRVLDTKEAPVKNI